MPGGGAGGVDGVEVEGEQAEPVSEEGGLGSGLRGRDAEAGREDIADGAGNAVAADGELSAAAHDVESIDDPEARGLDRGEIDRRLGGRLCGVFGLGGIGRVVVGGAIRGGGGGRGVFVGRVTATVVAAGQGEQGANQKQREQPKLFHGRIPWFGLCSRDRRMPIYKDGGVFAGGRQIRNCENSIWFRGGDKGGEHRLETRD